MRQDRLRATALAAVAGLVAPLAILIVVGLLIDRVRIGEVIGGSAFAVAYFAVTSLAVAFERAVVLSYVLKSLLVVGVLFVASFDGLDMPMVAYAIAVAALAYLVTQTVAIQRLGQRRQDHAALVSESVP